MDAITGEGSAGREHTTSEVNRVIAAIEQHTKAIAPVAEGDQRTSADMRAQATIVAAAIRAQAVINAKEEKMLAGAKRKADNAAEKAAEKEAKKAAKKPKSFPAAKELAEAGKIAGPSGSGGASADTVVIPELRAEEAVAAAVAAALPAAMQKKKDEEQVELHRVRVEDASSSEEIDMVEGTALRAEENKAK